MNIKNLSLLLAFACVVPVYSADEASSDAYPKEKSHQDDKAPQSKSYLEYIAHLGGAACSAVAGILIAKGWSSHCSTRMTTSAAHYNKAGELFSNWYGETYLHTTPSIPAGACARPVGYSYEFQKLHSEAMPKDHPYFAEMQKAWANNLNEGDAIPFCISAGLIIVAGILVYKCFFDNDKQEPETETA